jgi:hypothetical protein
MKQKLGFDLAEASYKLVITDATTGKVKAEEIGKFTLQPRSPVRRHEALVIVPAPEQMGRKCF